MKQFIKNHKTCFIKKKARQLIVAENTLFTDVPAMQ